MVSFIVGTLAGLVIAGCTALIAKQTTLRDARDGTRGYF